MARKQSTTDADVLQAMTDLWLSGTPWTTSNALAERLNSSTQTINRVIERLLAAGKVERDGRATRLRLANNPASTPIVGQPTTPPASPTTVSTPEQATVLLDALRQPLGTRKPVTYRCAFVDDYVPNSTFLLPPRLAEDLASRYFPYDGN